MRVQVRLIVLSLFSFVAMELTAQTQPSEKTATTPQKAKSNEQEMGKSYTTLRPEQKQLVDDFVKRYNQTTGSNVVPQQAYDNARLSIRTTRFSLAIYSVKMPGKRTDAYHLRRFSPAT